MSFSILLEMDQSHDEVTLDLAGLLCPLPVLKARKKLNAMPSGARLVLFATDPMSAIDIPHFCTEQGHVLETWAHESGRFTFKIRRK